MQGRSWCTPLVIILGLIILGLALATIWYRSRYPLSATQLQQARQLWEQYGPRNYNLQITIEGRMPGIYWIEVRHGRVVRALQRLGPDRDVDLLTVHLSDGRTIQRDGYEWSIPGLFDWLERDLERDRAGSKSYTYVRFDARDGHLIEYIRSESLHQYRVRVEFFPLPEDN
ncbi:MAG: hypothetical protein RMI91_05625 [Gemmatales bacterium]|nr:hypothetical protein [Gemmatales bacterium]MDW7994114.1 hypothetical protein [Gemmatales bacterium]